MRILIASLLFGGVLSCFARDVDKENSLERIAVKICRLEQGGIVLKNATDLKTQKNIDRAFGFVLLRESEYLKMDASLPEKIEAKLGEDANSNVVAPTKLALFGLFTESDQPIIAITLYASVLGENGRLMTISGLSHLAGDVYQIETSDKWFGAFRSKEIEKILDAVMIEKEKNGSGNGKPFVPR